MTLVPFLRGSDEHKSKPTQHSVKELQGLGIKPDIIVLRCDEPLEDSIFRKIAMFCNVKPDCVIENITLPSLYEAPHYAGEAELLRHRLPGAPAGCPQHRPDRLERHAPPDRDPRTKP